MYRFIRFFNQHRRGVFTIILIIVAFLAIIRVIDYTLENKKNNVDNINTGKVVNYVRDNNETVYISSNKSAVGGSEVSENKLNRETEIIEKFVDYCNNQQIKDAYDLLSDSCKEELFETEEIFKSKYYDVIFNNQLKTCDIENWSKETYKINMYNDILSTGNITEESTDYFTIVKQNDEYKLNIKSYIGRNNIDKEIENKDITIKVLNKDTYMDYEFYNIQISNNSANDITLDTKSSTKSTYLEDSKSAKYYAYTNENNYNEFIVRKNQTRNIRIKFSNNYSSSRKIERIVFSDFILNYDEYEQLENKEEYENIYKFIINI